MDTEILWGLDESGTVLGPSVHDGVIEKLVLSASDRMSIWIKNSESRLIRLDVLGVHDLAVRRRKGGNVVLDISAWRIRDIDRSKWEYCRIACRFLTASDVREDFLEIAIREYMHSYLLYVCCDDGSGIVIICDNFEFHND